MGKIESRSSPLLLEEKAGNDEPVARSSMFILHRLGRSEVGDDGLGNRGEKVARLRPGGARGTCFTYSVAYSVLGGEKKEPLVG